MDQTVHNQDTAIAWTGSWEAPPWMGIDYDTQQKRRGWFHHPAHREVRKKGAGALLDFMQSEEEDPEAALMALRAAAFLSGESDDIALVLKQSIDDQVVGVRHTDLWAEGWMAGKFIQGLMGHPADSGRGQLLQSICTHWPWLLVQIGRNANEPWHHPVYRMVRNGQADLAKDLIERIPASDWIATDQNKRSWLKIGGWVDDNPNWLMHLLASIPEMAEVDLKSGMGPLELAARNHKPVILRHLWEAGLRPDPEKSFGLGLAHWAAFGISEYSWHAKSGTEELKTESEIEQMLEDYQQTLKTLSDLGVDLDEVVAKVDTRGLRRARGMPKPKMTAKTYLDGREFKPSTSAYLERIRMDLATPNVKPTPRARGGGRL